MVSDKVHFDMSAPDLEDGDGNYKSYFARSMAVNSAYRESKCAAHDKQQPANNLHPQQLPPAQHQHQHQQEPPEVVRLRKDLRSQSWNASNACNGSQGSSGSHGGSTASSNSSRRTSLCSNIRIAESPVESFYLQSQVNTLQWQLKETESSREMYRAVMRQVVTFLERAHRSLELLGTRIKSNSRLSRPQSEYSINNSADALLETSSNMAWHWKKKSEASLDEVAPEKLSQEAYRLLRTAQSLLSTHEPDLAHVAAPAIEEDIGFLSQLAKEFPSHEGTKLPQRATSFSLCPKLLTPDKVERNQERILDNIIKDHQKEKLSSAASVTGSVSGTAGTFSRKYSLQLNDTVRRNSFLREVSKLNRSNESTSSRSSMIDTGEIFSSTLIDDKDKDKDRAFAKGFKFDKFDKFAKFDNYEKSSSPPVSSVGSAEDESGFSSMNSFQEVGIPHADTSQSHSTHSTHSTHTHTHAVHSTHVTEKRTMSNPHSNLFEDFRNFALDKRSPYNGGAHDDSFAPFTDDIKLWETPTTLHKRWSSTPVDTNNCLVLTEKAPVLWV